MRPLKVWSRVRKRLLGAGGASKEELFARAARENPWFSRTHLEARWQGLLRTLKEPELSEFLNGYAPSAKPKQVGLVTAGNLPAAGFQDLVCILSSGHKAQIKPSRQDTVMTQFLCQEIGLAHPEWQEKMAFPEFLKSLDALIAAGQDHTMRHFASHFNTLPHLLRGHKNGAAVLEGSETKEELLKLADDVFLFFGKGCRSVSKLYVPKNYDLSPLLSLWTQSEYKNIAQHEGYKNNYDYQKTLLLMQNKKHLDGGFLLLRETTNLSPPIGVLHYERYENKTQLNTRLHQEKEKTQLLVGKPSLGAEVPFGQAQYPNMYNDINNHQTMRFLGSLSKFRRKF